MMMHERSKFQNEAMDKTRGIGLEYISAAARVRQALMEITP